MLMDSVVIKLIKNGVGISPSYSLTIYGDGYLEYNENIKITGEEAEEISKEKVILLLSEFKDSGFFSLDDIYNVDEFAGRPYTIISISIPGRGGEIKTKTIRHYDDENMPDKIKKLEKLIDELASSAKRIKEPPKVVPAVKPVEKKKTSSSLEDAKRYMERMDRDRYNR